MDQAVFLECLSERRAISKDTYTRQKTTYLKSISSGHNASDEQVAKLGAINASLRFLRKQATQLCQPADSFVIQQIKQGWRALWDEEKVKLKNWSEWQEGLLKSGTLPNPRKTFFLRIAARAVRDANNMGDKIGLSYAQKCMIRSGLSMGLNAEWWG